VSDHPIVVVGAGPAGSATASLLAARGAPVVLFDSARFPRRKACAEYVSPGGVAILRSLGLGHFARGRMLRGMEIRAPNGARHLVEYRDTRGVAHYGLSIARFELDAALVEIARRRGVTVREGCRVASVTSERGWVTGVKLANGEHIRASLVIGADGMHSVVARAAGPPRGVRWPRRLGLVTHYHGVDWPETFGQMWVGRRGYLGVAPLDDDGSLSVGLVGPLGAGGARFDAALAEYPALAERLARGRRAQPILGIGPLARRVRACQGPGYLLVGDAAGFFDPFTGEGIFRALRGAQLAAASAAANLDYARLRQQAFAAKEQLTAVIQVFVQMPALMDLAVRRLQQRPALARQLGNVLGDLEPARLSLVWQLLRP
jgi:flavin-dependent dehydrogenase